MTELLSAASRFTSYASAAAIVGQAVFFYACMRASPSPRAITKFWPRVLAFGAATGHLGVLYGQMLAIEEAVASRSDWQAFLLGTHAGGVWLVRAGFALALIVVSEIPKKTSSVSWLSAGLAVIFLGLAPLGGHASAATELAPVLVVNIVHIISIAMWLGALPWWLWSFHTYVRGTPAAPNLAQLRFAVSRFSGLALVLMGVIVASGLYLTNLYINDQGDLLGTRYGRLLLAKALLLAVSLFCANRLRHRFLPAIGATGLTQAVTKTAFRDISLELSAALGALACASWLTQTTPALHEQEPLWWLPLRWSVDAAWSDPSLHPWIIAGLAAVAAGVVAAVITRSRAARTVQLLVLSLPGMGLLGWALAVKAYPSTFYRSQVPYLTVSVAHGRALFGEHCVGCHGSGGLGDGPLAGSLPRRPADLSQPHTALHTAGDMFWWLSNGIPASGMPGFASMMAEEERWDVINFLRAFSQGFESRVIGSEVVPRQAWLGAINFYLDGVRGPSELKGYRENRNVLLAFLGGEQASARARRLADAYPRFVAMQTEVLAIPFAGVQLPNDLPYPVILANGDEIWAAYQLLTRTVANRGPVDRTGMEWQQAELLIDRFGYVRARWLAEEDAIGWSDPATLLPNLDQLNREPQLKPFPDDHIH